MWYQWYPFVFDPFSSLLPRHALMHTTSRQRHVACSTKRRRNLASDHCGQGSEWKMPKVSKATSRSSWFTLSRVTQTVEIKYSWNEEKNREKNLWLYLLVHQMLWFDMFQNLTPPVQHLSLPLSRGPLLEQLLVCSSSVFVREWERGSWSRFGGALLLGIKIK